MKFFGKEISELTDDELWKASLSLQSMMDNNNSIRNTNRFKKKFEKQSEPGLNPAFVELKNSIEQELIDRKNRN